jgi:hypothetical protein
MPYDYLLIVIILISIPMYLYSRFYKNRQKKQLFYIKNYSFPSSITLKVKEKYPHLTDEELNKVLFALRDYFFIANKANGKTVAMPSKVVDVAWHEFILFTKAYQKFSQKSFGRFFHHTPTESIKDNDTVDNTLKLTWQLACFHENIMPSAPNRLPLLFAIDKLLKIEDGNIYTLGNNLTNTLSSHRYSCSSNNSGTSGCGGHSSCGGGGCGGS